MSRGESDKERLLIKKAVVVNIVSTDPDSQTIEISAARRK
jgi:hypothetical protein